MLFSRSINFICNVQCSLGSQRNYTGNRCCIEFSFSSHSPSGLGDLPPGFSAVFHVDYYRQKWRVTYWEGRILPVNVKELFLLWHWWNIPRCSLKLLARQCWHHSFCQREWSCNSWSLSEYISNVFLIIVLLKSRWRKLKRYLRDCSSRDFIIDIYNVNTETKTHWDIFNLTEWSPISFIKSVGTIQTTINLNWGLWRFVLFREIICLPKLSREPMSIFRWPQILMTY